MRLSSVSVLAVGAVAIPIISAAPIRLTIVTSEFHAINGSIDDGAGAVASARFGHPLSVVPYTGGGVLSKPPKKMGCGGLRNKALELSNSLRKTLGLESIVSEEESAQEVHIMPFFKPVEPIKVAVYEEPTKSDMSNSADTHHYALVPGHSPTSMTDDSQNFVERIHTALIALGPWEARAVAFVLGCGIGVLFRMIWVFAVLMFRGGRSEDEQEHEYSLVIEQVRDAEELPPKYIDSAAPSYVDEKTDSENHRI